MNENPNVVVKRRRGPAEIEQLVVEFAKSGMKAREFCAGQGLALSTLHRYLRKGRRPDGVSQSEGRLVPVELAGRPRENAGGWGLVVVLGSGRRIEVQRDFDEPTLERLMGVLERV